MPPVIRTIFEGALGGIGFVLGTALVGVLLVALHVALPLLIPITIIALALLVRHKLSNPKVKILPPEKSR